MRFYTVLLHIQYPPSPIPAIHYIKSKWWGISFSLNQIHNTHKNNDDFLVRKSYDQTTNINKENNVCPSDENVDDEIDDYAADVDDYMG